MTGDLLFGAGGEIQFGGSNQMGLFTSSGTSHLRINSGIFKLRADDMRFTAQNGTTEYMRIDSNGKVGIGATSPDAPLSIYDADLTTVGSGLGGIRVHRPGAFGQFGYMEYGYGSGTTYIGSSYTGGTAASYGVIQFRQHSNGGTPLNSMIIDASGKVGIGTSAPSSKLHVKHGDIRLEGNGELGQNITFTITNDNSGNEVEAGLIRFIDTGGGQSNRGAAIASYMPTADTGDLRFYTSAGADRVERIRIKSDGKVGIGVVPTHHFNLQGTGTVEARFRSTDGDMSLQISSDADETHNSELVFVSGTSGRGSIVYDHNTTAASQKMLFKTGDTNVTAMTILGDGNVGIGMTSPHGKLQFANDLNTRKIVLYEGANNDYQFYGFGIEGSTLVYSTYANTDDHVFFSGASTTTRNELMRIEGGGKVAINHGLGGGAINSQFNVFADGEAIRIDGTANASRTLRFRNAATNGSGNAIITSDGILQIKTEDANAHIYMNSVRDIAMQTTSLNGTAGHFTFSSYNTEIMRIDGGNNQVGIGTTSMSSSYGKLTVAGTGISITPDTAAKMQIGRYNAANPYSYIKAGSTSSGFKFTNAADSIDLLTIDSSGMSVPLVTTNDIKATGAGGVSIQTDEGTKRIEVFDNGKITFNNLIYQSGINNNTINSGYNADSEDSDMWINYRGYNDGHTRFRDFRIGNGKGSPIAFFDGSEMTANIHTLKVHTGSFRAVGTLPSTAGMALTGVGLGQLSNYAHAQFSGSAGGYIDFAEPNVDWSGRIIYTHSDDSMVFYSAVQPTMYLTQTGATVRNGPNANQGKLTFSTQSTAYNIMGGNYWGYLGLNSGGHIRLGSNNGEQMRLGAGVSTGNMALGLIGVTGVNSEAAIHGKSSDATLVLTNTDLSSNSTWGWTGRGGRVLTSNGTTWTNDGKDAALVIGSSKVHYSTGWGSWYSTS